MPISEPSSKKISTQFHHHNSYSHPNKRISRLHCYKPPASLMEGLQRSDISFRRQGSSGLVWDDKFLSGELNKLANERKEESSSKENKEEPAPTAARKSPPAAGLTIERSRSNGGRGFRTGKVSPAVEPPSPRVSACGCCGAFGKAGKTRRRPPKSGKRVI